MTFSLSVLSTSHLEILRRLSTDSQDHQANFATYSAQISADNRYVAFTSDATNLVSGDDESNNSDVFRKDLLTGQVEMVSRASVNGGPEQQGNDSSDFLSISADGRYVMFRTDATNLFAGDTTGSDAHTDVLIKDMKSGAITVASSIGSGPSFIPGNGDSIDGFFTPDGNHAVFVSAANNLVPSDGYTSYDIFQRDLTTGAVELLSTVKHADGTIEQLNSSSSQAAISANGHYLAFTSLATNVGIGNGVQGQIFRKNLDTGAVEAVSTVTLPDGTVQAGNDTSHHPRISADGRYVVFVSSAANFGVTTTNSQVYVKDMETGSIRCVSTASPDGSGKEAVGNSSSSGRGISPDGRYVFFTSNSNNLVTGDDNAKSDVFRKDLLTGETVRISVTADGAQALGGDSVVTGISPDGRHVLFISDATNLITGDSNGTTDLFMLDTALLNRRADVLAGRGIAATLAVGTATQADIAWGDGTTSTVTPQDGLAAFEHVYNSDGAKSAVVLLHAGPQSWAVPYMADVTGASLVRNTASTDTLSGSAGADNLTGDQYANTLIGHGGNDTLSGGAGDDRLEGGTGDDLFLVDSPRDAVIETPGGGTDTIQTSVSYALAADAEVEFLTATGSAAVVLSGNSFANVITGSGNADVLQGGAGNDKLYGGSGNDKLYGNDGNDTLSGGAGKDYLKGLNGNDQLWGGAGRDILYGGRGKDVFVFDTKPNKKVNLDRIVDFNVKDDTIWLDNKYYKKLGKGSVAHPGRLNKKFFTVGDHAKDKDDYLIYDNKKGILYYDADGSGHGKAVEIAQMKRGLKTMTYHDFMVI